MKTVVQLVILNTVLQWTVASSGEQRPPGTTPLAIDHVTVVVRDLEAARSPFERMGFTIKNGRLHENSINNLHIKFDNGTELELITASKPADAMAKEYLNLSEQGDGGAFCCIQTPTIDPLVHGLKTVGILEYAVSSSGRYRNLSVSTNHALRGFWYIEMPQVWRDQPKFTRHANGARGLVEVSVSSDVGRETVALFGAFGFPAKERAFTEETFVRLSDGELHFLDEPRNRNGRPILGVMFEVGDLDAVMRLFNERKVPFQRIGQNTARRVQVFPGFTKCIQISFRQPNGAANGSQPIRSETNSTSSAAGSRRRPLR